MAEPLRSPPATAITDLDEDAVVHCAGFLSLRDVCNLAMTSSALKRLAYSDSIWQRIFREQWHQQLPPHSGGIGAREVYLARHAAVRQFKFVDPFVLELREHAKPVNQLLLCENHLFWSQGSIVKTIDLDGYLKGKANSFHMLSDHKARITCMRLFPLNEVTSLFRGEMQGEQNVLVTSSCDHSIRLWWKGSNLRCFRGHNGPVLSLSNKLLGEDSSKVLASGGEDGTVRLWSLRSYGRRGQRALKATLYGHEKPVNLISVAGHKSSLLVTISRDSKVRVWDTGAATSSAVRTSCCVGMTSVPGTPVNMKCHESLLYVAAGPTVTAVDLRTMQKVITAAVHRPKMCSFDAVPSKYLICTGGDSRAMLWDIRRNQESLKPEPIAELDGHCGPVTSLYMDSYKIVTGCPDSAYVNVWEVDTGVRTNSFLCSSIENDGTESGCDAMAVDGCRITTASSGEDWSVVHFRDFNNATNSVTKSECEQSSKFWDSISVSDDYHTDD
ncbi:hypothetical protein Fmac_016762 [Flemingia macrophylla]|uniref:F-box domain-containing protein n=1 Tax=Flemingia macrophylla TaxID=520843 RepID=A0ABD1MIB4_9FABA